MDGKLNGRIDQRTGTLEIISDADEGRVANIAALSDSLDGLATAMFRDSEGFQTRIEFTNAPAGMFEVGSDDIGMSASRAKKAMNRRLRTVGAL